MTNEFSVKNKNQVVRIKAGDKKNWQHGTVLFQRIGRKRFEYNAFCRLSYYEINLVNLSDRQGGRAALFGFFAHRWQIDRGSANATGQSWIGSHERNESLGTTFGKRREPQAEGAPT